MSKNRTLIGRFIHNGWTGKPYIVRYSTYHQRKPVYRWAVVYGPLVRQFEHAESHDKALAVLASLYRNEVVSS